MNIIILYVLYIALFGVKLGMMVNIGSILYKGIQTHKWCIPLFLFSMAMTVAEIWFIYNFFNDIPMYYYEYLAVSNEVLLTILVTYYIIKEG